MAGTCSGAGFGLVQRTAAGVDQRLIDDWVGHTTEEMRRRYRHLIPSVQESKRSGRYSGMNRLIQSRCDDVRARDENTPVARRSGGRGARRGLGFEPSCEALGEILI